MFMASHETIPVQVGEEFSRPVESIMRCEDFKSNFARRLSNRYTSRSVSTPKPDTTLKLRPQSRVEETVNTPERIEAHSQLSKSIMEKNGEAVKLLDKSPIKSDPHCTEVTALNMEVDTLRWQLAQTEANRQMHIALLKQIVTFLNRVRDHIDNQINESPRKEMMMTRITPRSFNVADLPRSRSVLHFNKTLECSSPMKKISTKKISKSISNVNGYKDCVGHRNQIRCPLYSENETAQKISEETLRLITLANTVLSTNLPDLACTCTDNVDDGATKTTEINLIDKDGLRNNDSMSSLGLIEENTANTYILNTDNDSNDIYESINENFIEGKNSAMNDFIVTQSPLHCGLENDFATFELNEKGRQSTLSEKHVTETVNGTILKSTHNRRNEFSHVSNFIEDESGFSSMNSFQEIGIPIISIIPPSPCKEVNYIDEIPDILNEPEKWKSDTLELDKQTVKVFWV
ncbi:unnamed protein product [Diatraea saccharalis]|uniref:Uncharacterized protein n=1 Tax=Diatraea saccharalis TaxID=40085 RepID=A0A9N9MZY9_9NEOP|nr:unnamed protein product [Diatraea saccharalis]